MKRWYAEDGMRAPVEVECDVHGWPNKDAEGREQFVNTHFDSEVDAWENLIAERAIQRAKRDLASAEEELATSRREVEEIEAGILGRYDGEVSK